jgi:hypothetical protein
MAELPKWCEMTAAAVELFSSFSKPEVKPPAVPTQFPCKYTTMSLKTFLFMFKNFQYLWSLPTCSYKKS